MITIGSLFSGIGGLENGLERTGQFKTIWNSEIDPYSNAILRKHWPDVPNLGDITKVDWKTVERPDLICGGFPCQDISVAGKGAGIKEGTRSGLWTEFNKAIRILRPKYALVENVSALSFRGLCTVLADLTQTGYDAEWFTLRASDVGAPHRRERLFIIAYPTSKRLNRRVYPNGENQHRIQKLSEEEQPILRIQTKGRDPQRKELTTPNTNSSRRNSRENNREERQIPTSRKEWETTQIQQERNQRIPRTIKNTHAHNTQRISIYSLASINIRRLPDFKDWENTSTIEDIKRRPNIPQPLLRGNDYGFSNGLHRIKCLGNAVVPQLAQIIGEAIIQRESELNQG